jgi:hypothetical protein
MPEAVARELACTMKRALALRERPLAGTRRWLGVTQAVFAPAGGTLSVFILDQRFPD